MKKIKIATITDSPKCTTGFGNVARMLLDGFHKSGMEVYSFGTMDFNFDIDGELPYQFFPSNPFNPDGHKTVPLFLVGVQPDVIFILFDPGTTGTFLSVIGSMWEAGSLKKCPIVLYTPIEGFPVPISTAVTLSRVLDGGGKVVLYSQGMVDTVVKQYPQFDGYLDFVHHGLDHAPFRKYSDDYRKLIRKFVNLDDYFVAGSIGVNKRTKGLDTIIYTARCLKDMGKADGIKFYLHTSSNKPTMLGYNLEDLCINYDVEDMIIFKPEADVEEGGNINGIPRDNEGFVFENPSLKNLNKLSFIDRLNMFDCYLDLSQVEGWGLPLGEAMRCGVPSISVSDKAIREEVYKSGVIWVDTEPVRLWNTWHVGQKLALVDPLKAAEAILELKNSSDDMRKFWSDQAINTANKYNWLESVNKMNTIIRETVESYELSSM